MKIRILSSGLEVGSEFCELLFELRDLFAVGDGGKLLPYPPKDVAELLIKLMTHGSEFRKL